MPNAVLVDPLKEILTTLFAFSSPSYCPPCSAGVHDLLHCDKSTVWVAVLPTRFVIVPAFKTTETDVSFLAFLKNETIPQVWFGVQPSNWHD